MAGSIGPIQGGMMHGSGHAVVGLIQGNLGVGITQASLTSIAYAVYRLDGSTETTTGTGSLTIANVVFDIPVTNDPRYVLSGGYNFLAIIPASCFQTANRRHRVEVTFTPATGEVFIQQWVGVPA